MTKLEVLNVEISGRDPWEHDVPRLPGLLPLTASLFLEVHTVPADAASVDIRAMVVEE
jgi:hypothetical protein